MTLHELGSVIGGRIEGLTNLGVCVIMLEKADISLTE